MMKSSSSRALIALSALSLAGDFSSAAIAQTPPRQIPKGWTYEVDSRGNRIARVNRVVKPDGSWREELRQGNCLTVRERSATGEYKETTQCSGGNGS